MDKWQIVFVAGATLFVALRAWRGWRLGVVRQLLTLVIIVAAYAAAFFGGRRFFPLLRPLGFPDQILAIIAGAILAIIVFVVGNAVVAIVFKRTAEQKVGVVRFGYGFFGALIGALFGLVIRLDRDREHSGARHGCRDADHGGKAFHRQRASDEGAVAAAAA
jgi:uncharacterized membrane protein required for colicin V production